MKRFFRRLSAACLPSAFLPGREERRKFSGILILSALLCCFVGSGLHAQDTTGSIVGTVTDANGAVIQGAAVSAKDMDRGSVLNTRTNDSGAFSFSGVPVGNYEVTVTAKGFRTAHHEKFPLVLNQAARLDFQMAVGEGSETVEVVAEAPLLQTDTTLLGNVLNTTAIRELPLSTGNLNQLTLLTAGVVTPNLFGFQAAQNTFGTGRPYVNGAREQENNFVLDGMDNNQADNNDVGYVPSPEAVQEFNLITGNAPADFGNYLGGVVNVTLKSGTNKYHGSIFEYLRNSDLNANSWANNARGVDANGHEIAPRPGLHYNRFGFTFGGPIVKNKLFFFADYQESLFHQPSTPVALGAIPLAERAGDFSALCTAGFTAGVCNNPIQQLFDPASSANPATRTAFLNNQIPTGRFNSASRAIITSPLYPSAQIANGLQTFSTDTYQGDLKIDYVPSERDHVMGRWSQQYVNAPTQNSIQLLGDFTRTFPLKNAVVDWTHTLTPSLLNDLRVGFSYFPVTESVTNPTGQNLPAVFGIAGVAVNFLPAINVNGESNVGVIGNPDLAESFHDTTLQFEDSVTWTHGNHVIHTGFEAYRYIMNVLYPGNAGLAGQFNFNGQFTGNTGTTGGSAIADFLLGLPVQVLQGNGGGGNKYLRNSLFGIYAQDNWRVKNNLTLNLGLRYELTTARSTNNGQDINFDLITGVPSIGSGYNTYAGIDNFQPRLGFAWQPHWLKNTVIRGAYGISTFMEANGVNNLPYQNPPFVQAHTASYAGLALPNSTLSQGFAGFPSSACTVAALQAFSPACLASNTLHLTNPDLQPAVDQQWNFGIQHQLGRSTSISATYVGNKIDHMSDIFIFNQKFLNPDGTVSPGPFAQPLINCCGAGNSPTIRFNDSSGIQRYNALQLSVAQREWHGLQYQANYTWSKCLSNGLGYFGQFGDEEALPGTVSQTNSSFFFQNAYDAKADYGRCIADVASLFNGFLTYDLPFGKGKAFGGGSGRVVNTIIGNWKMGTDFTFHTGFAINPSAPDQSGTNAVGATRPNCVAGVSQEGSGALENIGGTVGIQFLNPAAVSLPAPGTFGNCGAGSFRGPGLKTVDLNLSKEFVLTERANLLFRAEFINLTNTPIFGAPNANCGPICNGVVTTGPAGGGSGAGTFGFVSSTNPGRQVQFALKVSF